VIHHGIELETIPRRKKTDLTKNLIFAGRIIYGKGIQDRIIFAGGKAREDVLSLLSESDIFINPSYSEGLPISILEAGAVGLPVIATDVGGTKELIFPHQTGLLIPPQESGRPEAGHRIRFGES